HLDDLFEKAYYSHTSGMRKPDTAFFELILKENSLIAENTLFVDDFIENINAAESLNIKTYHIANGNTILDLY
ncbi:MAG: HAD-IA family hydrolase, partial [Bacteroidales bacterium]|nr:HAD-IA family hydrolase [Bacteroidales bacterium]